MNHLELAHDYWRRHLQGPCVAVDATCGNGRDTLFLAETLHPGSSLLGMDIQPMAIEKTRALLEQKSRTGMTQLFTLCHSQIDLLPYPTSPQLIVYNLGYLPGGNKALTTQTNSTLISLNKAIVLLAPEGALSITCYPGHSEGMLEEKAVVEWAQSLSHAKWQVCYHQWINRSNAPSLIWLTHRS